MISTPNPEDIDVVILCGGLGTRLRSVINDRPKVMAEINKRPFLDILIDYIASYKFRRFILCIGHMGDVIKKYYEKKDKNLTVLFSEEKEPLGTGGAIINAEALIKSDPFLAINGDSLCRIDIKEFLKFHIEKKAVASIALVSPERDADYGVVTLDSNQRIISFNEKAKPDVDAYISAGMYFFSRDIIGYVPANTNYSLEYDLFPNIIDKGIYGYITGEKLIDIGTPERYTKAEEFLNELQ